MNAVLNISAYRFVALAEPATWREQIMARGTALGLKGTVLLAGEGINLFVAGPVVAVREFIAWLDAQPPFTGIEFKESESDDVPFGKLIVKVKPEIIRMNQPTVRPQAQRAPAIDAVTLARWLDDGHDDAGRPLVMLDTRNAFEVAHGRFDGALDWGLARFSEFPQALQAHRAELDGKTVVSYCTGGIRCEKAALWMADAGIENVWQLDGGILKYLETHLGPGDSRFKGHCFVFDQREALDDTLSPVPTSGKHRIAT